MEVLYMWDKPFSKVRYLAGYTGKAEPLATCRRWSWPAQEEPNGGRGRPPNKWCCQSLVSHG
jgi:hypothetical protein